MRSKSRIAIVGAGPAGITAAIQLARYGFRPLLFEKKRVGGLLNNAYRIENYPGFSRGMSGTALVRRMAAHLRKYGIEVVKQEVKSVARRRGEYIVEAKKIHQVDQLVIASGTSARKPGIRLPVSSPRIFHDVYPIRNVRGKRVAIVGTGDAGLDYALNLGRRNHIILIGRSKKAKGLPLLLNRVRALIKKRRVTYLADAHPVAVKDRGSSIDIRLREKPQEEISCDLVLFAIGREPTLDFLPRSMFGHFPQGTGTLHFIGDVINGAQRQASIAVGDGMKAAMQIAGEIEKTKKTFSPKKRRERD